MTQSDDKPAPAADDPTHNEPAGAIAAAAAQAVAAQAVANTKSPRDPADTADASTPEPPAKRRKYSDNSDDTFVPSDLSEQIVAFFTCETTPRVYTSD